MIGKDYYRLDELIQMGIPTGTVRYLIEQRQLQPLFFITPHQFVIGGYVQNKFNGFAIASYGGLVAISNDNNAKLLTKGKVVTQAVLLAERDKIIVSSQNYPFKVPCPNAYIEGWQSWLLADLPWNSIPAKFYPTEQDSGMAMLFKALKLATSTQQEKEIFERTKEQTMASHPERVLNSAGYTFCFDDICIRHKDLLAHGLIKSQVKQQTVALPLADVTGNGTDPRCKNEFEELLLTVLTAHPDIKAKQVHRLLCDEANREEDTRLFDHKNILLGEDQGIITWRDKYRNNEQRSYVMSSLDNEISKARTKLRQ